MSLKYSFQSNTRAYLSLIVVTWGWGCNAILGKIAVGEISPMLLVSLRWLGLLILLLVFMHRQLIKDWPVLKQHLGYFALMGTMGFTLFNALFYLAAHTTSAINIGIIQGAIPVFVFLGTYLFLRARITAMQIFGAGITLVGVVVVATKGQFSQLQDLDLSRGDMLMLIACFCYAAYSIGLTRRPVVSPFSLLTMLSGFAFLASLPLLLIEVANQGFEMPTTTGWLIAGVAIVLPSLVSQFLFIQAVGLVGAARASMFVNLVPIFAAIMAVFYLGEQFEGFHAVSLGLVLSGIALAELGKGNTALSKV
jgi:drug/metabolite transporter (DMT)-like permease